MKWFNKRISFWNNQSPMARLWIGLMISGLIYLGFTVPFPLHGYYATTPPVDYAKLTNHSLLGFLAYVAGIGSLFGLYTILWRTLAKTDLKIRFVLLSGTLLALILVFSYPQTAIDLFVYAIRTRGWARYGLDPFSTTPDVMPISDPWLGLAGEWVDAASPYGPIWEWLSLGTFHASGGGYLGHLFALKILSVLVYGGSVWLLYRILLFFRPLRPQWAVAGAAFFAWNPLVLLEGVQNAHNDLSMVFFFLLATWGFLPLVMGGGDNHKILYAGVFVAAFAASILVKFIPLLLLPFFFLGAASRHSTWLRWIASGVLYGLAILLLVFLVMAPYWPGAGNWAVLYAGKSAGRSLMALMILALRSKVGTNLAFDYVQASIYAVLAGIYFWNLWRVGRQAAPNKKRGNAPGSESIIESIFLASFNVLFWYILIGASTFHAWYLLWILPLAALFIPDGRPARAAVVFSMVSLLIIPYYETMRVWFPLLLRNHLLGHIIGVALLFIPTLSAKFCQSSRIKINH